MIASDEVLERMQADGKISPADADAVRTFGDFLGATAGIPRNAEHRTPAQQQAFSDAYREHYPEDWERQQREHAARIGASYGRELADQDACPHYDHGDPSRCSLCCGIDG